LVCLPLLIFPCIKSRGSLLAPAHPGSPGKRAIKWLRCGVVYFLKQKKTFFMFSILECFFCFFFSIFICMQNHYTLITLNANLQSTAVILIINKWSKYFDNRPHCRHTWTVHWYSLGGTCVHPHLIHVSLGPPEPSTQTASQSVQPFLQGSLL